MGGKGSPPRSFPSKCKFFLVGSGVRAQADGASPPSSPAPRRQYPLGFALSFSRWMCRHPELYRLQAEMNASELTVTGDLVTKGTRVLVSTRPGCRDLAGGSSSSPGNGTVLGCWPSKSFGGVEEARGFPFVGQVLSLGVSRSVPGSRVRVLLASSARMGMWPETPRTHGWVRPRGPRVPGMLEHPMT